MRGREYEDRAVSYLKKRRYEIISRNYRTRFGEIDIIAREGKTLVFVEVKGGKENPRFRVNRDKMRKIELTANHFLNTHDVTYSEIRLDVIEITSDGVKHFKGISI